MKITESIKALFATSDTSTGSVAAMKATPFDIPFQVFLWMSVVFVISLSLPQLFKLIKDKKTGDVSFTSFWIFHIGILLWVVWGATNQLNQVMLNVMVADGVSLFVNGVMTILLYKHKAEFSAERKMRGYIGVGITWVIGAVLIGFYIADWNHDANSFLLKVPATASTVMGFVFPALTTLAFTPQLVQSFKTNQWQSVTYWMYVLYVVNNIVWIIWWCLGIAQQNAQTNPDTGSLFAGLTWQIISLILFSVQLGFTLHDRILIKKGIRKAQ
ncbi:hypothetical protein H9M94_00070 [Mycoplasma sp. Pen4]|uniref:PQ-loop domain-containing transporter n=1 Tax=Mycoplasma sp. Pen4 TaxID=640330 RepID=UPI0016545E38|nr:PQ-loop domain-containing transporter [Mycoplasma sp. Pen4]QNM93662.1 hypothetical protein H9M94_00070 [Mycoplasma sp. Pen4]